MPVAMSLVVVWCHLRRDGLSESSFRSMPCSVAVCTRQRKQMECVPLKTAHQFQHWKNKRGKVNYPTIHITGEECVPPF